MKVIFSIIFIIFISQTGNLVKGKIINHEDHVSLIKDYLKKEISKHNKIYNDIAIATKSHETTLENLGHIFHQYIKKAIYEMQNTISKIKPLENHSNCKGKALKSLQILDTEFLSFYKTECTYFIEFLNFGNDVQEDIQYYGMNLNITSDTNLDDDSDLADLIIDVVLKKFDAIIQECYLSRIEESSPTRECLIDKKLTTFLEHVKKVTDGTVDLHNSFMDEYNLESSSCYKALLKKGYLEVLKINKEVTKCLSGSLILDDHHLEILQ